VPDFARGRTAPVATVALEALGVAFLVVLATVFSFSYNAVTRKPMAVPAGLSYVRTDA
jgi:hypothetical protein